MTTRLVTSCGDCPFFGESHVWCQLDGRSTETVENRPDWCPLEQGPVMVQLGVTRVSREEWERLALEAAMATDRIEPVVVKALSERIGAWDAKPLVAANWTDKEQPK